VVGGRDRRRCRPRSGRHIGSGVHFYQAWHGMTTGRLDACRGRWSFLLARHAQDGAVLVLAVGGDAIGDGGSAGAPRWGWCGSGSGPRGFGGLSRCGRRRIRPGGWRGCCSCWGARSCDWWLRCGDGRGLRRCRSRVRGPAKGCRRVGAGCRFGGRMGRGGRECAGRGWWSGWH
jgi:hypothetical protein